MRAATRQRLLAQLEQELLQLKLKIEANHWQPYNSAAARRDKIIPQLAKPASWSEFQRLDREAKQAKQQLDAAWEAIQEQAANLTPWMNEAIDLEFDIQDLRKAFAQISVRREL